MAAYLDSGRLIDAILALLALEALLLITQRLTLHRGPACASSIANSLAGAGLLLAMRAAITNASFAVVGACLLAALVAHLADLATRWRASPRADDPLPNAQSSSSALASVNSRV